MVINVLFLFGAFLMIVSLLFGTVELIFLNTIFMLVLFSLFYDKLQNCDCTNTKKNIVLTNKKQNIDTSEPIKCFHAKSDCEECLSQSVCQFKDDNILIEMREE